MVEWPGSPRELIAEQDALAVAQPPPWRPHGGSLPVAGCFVCFPRGVAGVGAPGDRGWAGAALVSPDGDLATAAVTGTAGARYRAGLLALREGPLLEAAVRALPSLPEVLLVNATGRDHPRRAGLALHLGALLGVATVGVTHRPLLAEGEWPGPSRGARSPLVLDGEEVGCWLRTRPGRRPLAVHAAWRTDAEAAAEVVLGVCGERARTPQPLRQARRVARTARAAAARAGRRLRLVPGGAADGGAPAALSGAGRRERVEIATAPPGEPPFGIDAVALEDDTYLVLGADPAWREPDETLVEVLTAAHAARPEPPGSVVVRPGRPPRLHAVVHDLARDPTWTEEWIESALLEVLEMTDARGLAALGLEPLGCLHGRLGLSRFRVLLKRALAATTRRSLRRVWVIVPEPGSAASARPEPPDG